MIELSVRKPVGVTVGVIFVVLFGTLSLFLVPIQLTPDVVKPQITVETTWRGASPHEIEREIVEEQEEQLRGVEGLLRLTSESIDGLGRIVLEFPPGENLDSALIRVSNRLEQVPEYPPDADKPVISTTNKTDNAMAWFMLHRLPGNTEDIESYYRLADEVIKPRLERVRGVGAANIMGGREEELHVIIDPIELASRGITISDLIRRLDRENVNTSAGDFDEGKRKYKVRTVGEYTSPESVESVVIQSENGRRVYVRDVAEVRLGLAKRLNFTRQQGEPTLAINSVRSIGANVLETMVWLKETVRELNSGVLADERLELVQVYDETEYIEDSISNVKDSLIVGSVLAIVVLFVFLRSVASTFIIAVAIPISVVGSFILLYLLGRTVNVVSLAGMSFASGMVVDNSIVSLENIYRLRQNGLSRIDAAIQGAREVWGAILASTLTTVAVFLPVFFVEEKAAQLFRDIALAISCSVGLSLFVSITVIPAMAARLIKTVSGSNTQEGGGVLSRLGSWIAAAVGWTIANRIRQLATVVSLTGVSLWLAWAYLPSAEYLPEGNRNLAIGILVPPPGYSIDALTEMGTVIEERLAPLVDPESPEARIGADRAVAEAASSPGEEARAAVTAQKDSSTPRDSGAPKDTETESLGPRIRRFFFVAREASVFLGAIASDPAKAGELVETLKRAVADIPGLIALVQQASLFERGIATGRRVDIEISGPDLEELVRIGGAIFGQILGRFPPAEGHQSRPIPSLDLDTPEIHVVPDPERAGDLGLDTSDVGLSVNAIIDGAKASDVTVKGRQIDLVVTSGGNGQVWRTQDLDAIPISTPAGGLVPLSAVAEVSVARGPQQINHIERRRAITIQFVPSSSLPVEEAAKIIEAEIVRPLETSGAVSPPYEIRLAGTVDDLSRAFVAFRANFALALIITYLLMCALFDSFLYPFVILFTVPLAAVGGVLCLNVVHAFAPGVKLDILTMLGFVILIGVVVNNAILIVYQALDLTRAGRAPNDAIVESVRTRLRPILMTTATSVIGMLPLVVSPGAGSELYRGLGSVILGGLTLSTVLTLVLIPTLLAFFFTFFDPRRGFAAAPVEEAQL
jgi:HAE1 family hydrophobic/amphiphilic exporter-1